MIKFTLEDSIENNINNTKKLVSHKKKVDKNYIINLGGIISGFYLGYSESKGVQLDLNTINALLVSPTIISLIYAPLNKYTNELSEKEYSKYRTPLGKKILKMQFNDGPKKEYSQLNPFEKRMAENIIPELPSLIKKKSFKKNVSYTDATLGAGIMSASATALGYGAGRLIGQYL